MSHGFKDDLFGITVNEYSGLVRVTSLSTAGTYDYRLLGTGPYDGLADAFYWNLFSGPYNHPYRELVFNSTANYASRLIVYDWSTETEITAGPLPFASDHCYDFVIDLDRISLGYVGALTLGVREDFDNVSELDNDGMNSYRITQLAEYVPPPSVPEPASLVLWSGLGMMGLIAARATQPSRMTRLGHDDCSGSSASPGWLSDPVIWHPYNDDYSGVVRLQVFDGLLTDTDEAELTVLNVAPSVAANAAAVTVNEGAQATNAGTFSDPGGRRGGLEPFVGNNTPRTFYVGPTPNPAPNIDHIRLATSRLTVHRLFAERHQRIVCRSSRPEAIQAVYEVLFIDRFPAACRWPFGES